MSSRIPILGVSVDRLTKDEVLQRCSAALRGTGLTHIVTANPEILLCARRDRSCATVVQQADLVLPDGVGLALAARFSGHSLPERIPGIDFFTDLCRLAAREGKRVYLLGGWSGVAAAVAARLRWEFPQLEISAFAPDHAADTPSTALWEAIASFRPSLLFVAYGAPKQERWIAAHRERLEKFGVRIAMGVGGAFDTLGGKAPRAPQWMRTFGFEWLWRLILEPRRFPRIIRATIMFPLTVVFGK